MSVQVKKPNISAAILAHDEAADLAQLLPGLTFTTEIVVADASSADDTAAVARAAGARVFAVPNNLNLNANKTRAVEACSGEWVLYLDPDERVTAALASAVVNAAVTAPADVAAFEFPRLNNYFGRYLRYGGAYPDYQLRLFRRGRARFACRSVHERLEIDGRIGRVHVPLLHETYPHVADYLRKLPLYVSAGADTLARRGIRVNVVQDLASLFLKPVWRFKRRFLFKLGLLDGWRGWLACALDALQYMLTYYEYRRRVETLRGENTPS